MEKVVMVDLDGTVINEQYQPTANISALVMKALDSGICIVPSSDTPVDRLRQSFYDSLCFLPEIVVAENGSLVAVNDEIVKLHYAEGIEAYKQALADAFTKAGFSVVVCDSVKAIKMDRFQPSSTVIIMDAMRQLSIGFYVRSTNAAGVPYLDDSRLTQAQEIASKVKPPKDFELVFNPGYGIAIASSKRANKTNGYQFLRMIFPDSTFYMIGNGEGDIIDSNLVVHCAVANAVDRLAAKVSFIAGKPYTEGVAECLEWIMGQ